MRVSVCIIRTDCQPSYTLTITIKVTIKAFNISFGVWSNTMYVGNLKQKYMFIPVISLCLNASVRTLQILGFV